MTVSVRKQVRSARAEEARIVRTTDNAAKKLGAVATIDSFVNFAMKMGIGADTPLSGATYGYNPISRNRVLLEWIHRGSWLGGQAIDIIANDMTRAGIHYTGDLEPDDAEVLTAGLRTDGTWDKLNECIKWGRLYGGAIAVMLIDGQDPKTPLRLETVGADQYKGLLVLDRWMLEPSLEDLVTEFGPHLGQPKFYRVTAMAPALRGAAIHHSRIALRHNGVELPYQQSLTENLWGVSVLERLYDRMVGFDSASTGIAQLVYKCYLRTLSIKDLRTLVASGGKAMEGLAKYAEVMRRYQSIEGLTLIDAEDTLEVQTTAAFSGMGDALDKLGEQLSGALQIPLVRLFGQSPAGLSSTGESDMRNYYDGINQQQEKLMHTGVETVCKLKAQSEGINLPEEFGIEFASLWKLSEDEKANTAKAVGEAVSKAMDSAIIGRQTALKELKQSSKVTGVFTNITREMIESADDEVMPPGAEMAMGMEHDMDMLDKTHEHQGALAKDKNQTSVKIAASRKIPGAPNGKAGQNGKKKPVAGSAKRRAFV